MLVCERHRLVNSNGPRIPLDPGRVMIAYEAGYTHMVRD